VDAVAARTQRETLRAGAHTRPLLSST
jgi:hypothetical protein